MPAATRLLDFDTFMNVKLIGSPNVFVNSRPAHRLLDFDNMANFLILGDPTVFVNGRPAGRLLDFDSSMNFTITGSPNVRFGTNNTGAQYVGKLVPNNPYTPKYAPVYDVTGIHGVLDEESDETDKAKLPTDFVREDKDPAIEEKDNVEEVDDGPPVTECDGTVCDLINDIDYDYQLSPNFRLRDLTIDTVFPHTITAQNGLSVSEIICNLKAVANNILEPLLQVYPDFNINSGFRRGFSTSQHNKGQAVDLQWPAKQGQDYVPILEWLTSNVPYSQIISEHGRSIWIHISYARDECPPRAKQTTYYPKDSPKYTSGLRVHY